MKTIRKGVFETNSSSSHSISLDYNDINEWGPSLPNNLKSESVKIIDILQTPLLRSGYAFGEVHKLRIVISLITEMIYYEYEKRCQQEWVEKNGLQKYSWSYQYSDFYCNKKLKSKGAYSFVINHSYWKYLNNLLKKELNINVKIYNITSYFPYVSEFIDYGLGCETRDYYRELGFKLGMKKEEFQKLVKEIVFDSNNCICQETSERY